MWKGLTGIICTYARCQDTYRTLRLFKVEPARCRQAAKVAAYSPCCQAILDPWTWTEGSFDADYSPSF